MLDYDYGTACALLYLIYQYDSLLACCRVKVCKRLVKKKHVNLADHDSPKTYTLLLSARYFVGRVPKYALYIDYFGYFRDSIVHLLRGNAVIFQSKRYILRYGKADKLPVGILKHRTDDLRQAEKTKFKSVFTFNCELSRCLARI